MKNVPKPGKSLITRRSVVRIGSPLLRRNQSTQHSGFLLAARTVDAPIFESEDLKMNQRSLGSKTAHTSMLLSKAIDGFLTFKLAEGLSKRTIDSYEHTLRHWLNHVGELKVSQIRTTDLFAFLAWMRTDYKPRRWNGNTEPLSAKSLRNVYVSLRAQG